MSPLYDEAKKPFYHGVASGDPLTDRVIIWTRVTPEDSVSALDVSWELAGNERFDPVLKTGSVNTSPSVDYTVKVDVTGLQPDTHYYYRFHSRDKVSPVGKTKTLPERDVDSVKLAVVSCSNWQHGYFNAYDRIASKELDLVIHLGDYIYEYGVNNARNVDRKHLPEHEIVTLADYRIRYSQYHLDEGLQKMRQRHPLITIWDDHELANDTYKEGAENHQPEEGDFAARKAAARKAYYEWIPIRDGGKHYRSFSFGDLAELIMLDERQEGRTRPVGGISDSVYRNDDRSMLGEEQLTWLEEKLSNRSATWKVIGNQVMFSDFDRSAVNPDNPRNMDSWDGYPAEKQRVSDFIKTHKVQNIIFLTGDTHASWAFEVVASPLKSTPRKGYQPLAVEFGTTSVSSTNSNEFSPDDTVMLREQMYLKTNPHLKFVNQRDHGYLLLTLSGEKAKAQWYFVGTLMRPDTTETMAKAFEVKRNSNNLK
ncbi:MAG TPA: alkaline phosphatase D family protein [Chryseosolibacter sp.]|nr:alkaline phosphatase D family protein [Chryseosolibacter sp.]